MTGGWCLSISLRILNLIRYIIIYLTIWFLFRLLFGIEAVFSNRVYGSGLFSFSLCRPYIFLYKLIIKDPLMVVKDTFSLLKLVALAAMLVL